MRERIILAALILLTQAFVIVPSHTAITHPLKSNSPTRLTAGVYWFQVGVYGGTYSGYGDRFGSPITGASVDIRIRTPQTFIHHDADLSYWVGIDLPNDSFIQVGYVLDPRINGGQATWFWEYFLPGTAIEGTGGFLGKEGSVIGPNGTWMNFSIASSGNIWSAYVDQKEVGSINLQVSNSGGNGPYASAEVAKVRETDNPLGLVEFRNLEYRDMSSMWHPVKTGVSLCCYSSGSDSYDGAYPYGVEGILGDNNHWLAGSGLPTREKGDYLWPWYYVNVHSNYGQVVGSGWYLIDELVVPQATQYGNVSAKERMVLTGWYLNGNPSNYHSFLATEDLNLTAIYTRQFLITVISQYSSAVGSGWYNKGDKATVGVSAATIPDDGLPGDLGFKTFLLAWVGDYTAVPAGRLVTLTVDSPKTIATVWADSAWSIPILVSTLATIVFLHSRRGKHPKKMKEKTKKATSKSYCIECGSELPLKSKFCNNCGTRQP